MQGLQECLALAERPQVDVAKAPARLKEYDKQIEWAKNKKSILYGFEEIGGKQLDAMVEHLKSEKTRLQNYLDHEGMARLSLEPLKWRDKNGYPTLVLFGLDSPKFEISAQGDWDWNTHGIFDRRVWTVRKSVEGLKHLDNKLLDYYQDVFEKVRTLSAKKKADVILSCSYSGIIPEETRKKIDEYRSKFARLYVLSEAKDWKVTVEEKPKPPVQLLDPLLVGWDKTDLWLIDHFEMTTLERLVASQFTTG